MFTPKIKFKEMTLEENINHIKWMYFRGNGVLSISDLTIKYFPELANLDSNLSRHDTYKKIEDVVTKYYNKNYDKIKNDTKRYDLIWKDYNDKYFETLASFLNINWPKNVTEIVTKVGLLPIFPRHLDTFSFEIGINVTDKRLLTVCAHETLHFLWFEKWKQIHPETPRREYDSPYLVWQYSEMVTDPILNNKPLSNIFEFNERGYNSFYELEDNGNKVMDKLREIYSKDIPVEEKINLGYEYINQILNKNNNKKIIK